MKKHFYMGVATVYFGIDGVTQEPMTVNTLIAADDNGPINQARITGLAEAAVHTMQQQLQVTLEVANVAIINIMYLGEMTAEEYLGHPVAEAVTDITGQIN